MCFVPKRAGVLEGRKTSKASPVYPVYARTLFREALTDDYVRRSSKASRNYPRKNNEKPAGKPVRRAAHRELVRHAKEPKALQQGNQLTA